MEREKHGYWKARGDEEEITASEKFAKYKR